MVTTDGDSYVLCSAPAPRFLRSQNSVQTAKVFCLRPSPQVVRVYKHAKRSHTPVKEPVVHVRVRWKMETPKITQNAHARARAHTHTHTHKLHYTTHTHTHTQTQTHTHTHTHTHTRKHTHTRTHTHALTHARARTHARTHSRTRAHTHTLTHRERKNT